MACTVWLASEASKQTKQGIEPLFKRMLLSEVIEASIHKDPFRVLWLEREGAYRPPFTPPSSDQFTP